MIATEHHIRIRFLQALSLYDLLEPNEDEMTTYRLNAIPAFCPITIGSVYPRLKSFSSLLKQTTNISLDGTALPG